MVTIAVLNVCFGFSVAIYMRQLMNQSPEIQTADLVEDFLPTKVERELMYESVDQEVEEQESSIDLAEAIPQEFIQMLESEDLVANSLVEASAQVLRLEVGIYRNKLVEIENQLRKISQPKAETLESIALELDEINQDWLEKQSNAADHLDATEEDLGSYADIADSLSAVLMDQAAQIETTLSNLHQLPFDEDSSVCSRKLMLEIHRLLGLAHDLRDKMQETLLTILRSERRLGTIEENLQLDSHTHLRNRTGLEVTFFKWWKGDIRRERMLSVALLDIDKFKKTNESFGTEVCDRFIKSFAQFLIDLSRKDRGFDVFTRYAGQRFGLFFGDTGPRNATSAVERIRQTLEVSTFHFEGKKIEVTLSAGVTEVDANDSTTKVFKRLEQSVRTAKKNGRNRTFIDEGNGPQAIDPPGYNISGLEINIS